MSSSSGSDMSGSESDGDGSDGSGRRGRSPEEIRRDNRRLLRENIQLKKRIRMKDFNLRQMGAYAASGGNKTAVVSNLDDNAVQQSIKACLATCCMIANWMRVDVTPFYKWATAGWINWSTDQRTLCKRCCDLIRNYVPEGWGLMTFWFMWVAPQIEKYLLEQKASSKAALLPQSSKNIVMDANVAI